MIACWHYSSPTTLARYFHRCRCCCYANLHTYISILNASKSKCGKKCISEYEVDSYYKCVNKLQKSNFFVGKLNNSLLTQRTKFHDHFPCSNSNNQSMILMWKGKIEALRGVQKIVLVLGEANEECVSLSWSRNQLAIEKKVNLKAHLMIKYINILHSEEKQEKSTLETHSIVVSERLSS